MVDVKEEILPEPKGASSKKKKKSKVKGIAPEPSRQENVAKLAPLNPNSLENAIAQNKAVHAKLDEGSWMKELEALTVSHKARRKAIIIALEESRLKWENDHASWMAAIPNAKCQEELVAIVDASRASREQLQVALENAVAQNKAVHAKLDELIKVMMDELKAR